MRRNHDSFLGITDAELKRRNDGNVSRDDLTSRRIAPPRQLAGAAGPPAAPVNSRSSHKFGGILPWRRATTCGSFTVLLAWLVLLGGGCALVGLVQGGRWTVPNVHGASAVNARSIAAKCAEPQLLHPRAWNGSFQGTGAAQYHASTVASPDHFTLIVNSYKRHALLQRFIAHYAQCATVDSIRVVWCEDGLPPSQKHQASYYSSLKEVRYDVMPSRSLNSRFTPLEGIRTEAVMSLDDDVLAPCSELDRLFQVWRDNKLALVGFYPRLHLQLPDCSYKYMLGFGTLTWSGQYSMVLTKAAVLHRDFLEHYSHHMPRGIREYVDAVHNCEDIAMQLLMVNLTGVPPIFVHSSRVRDLGKGVFKVKGISSGKGHSKVRSNCLLAFASFYGGSLPLQARNVSDGPTDWWLRWSPLVDTVSSLFAKG